jgi:hypothetical protein
MIIICISVPTTPPSDCIVPDEVFGTLPTQKLHPYRERRGHGHRLPSSTSSPKPQHRCAHLPTHFLPSNPNSTLSQCHPPSLLRLAQKPHVQGIPLSTSSPLRTAIHKIRPRHSPYTPSLSPLSSPMPSSPSFGSTSPTSGSPYSST